MIPFGLSGVDQDTMTAVLFRTSTCACFGAEGAIGIELEVYESMFCVISLETYELVQSKQTLFWRRGPLQQMSLQQSVPKLLSISAHLEMC